MIFSIVSVMASIYLLVGAFMAGYQVALDQLDKDLGVTPDYGLPLAFNILAIIVVGPAAVLVSVVLQSFRRSPKSGRKS